MTAEEFNSLGKEQQKFLLCDADKIFEKKDDSTREELFKIENLYVEVKVNSLNRFKRQITAYAFNQFPVTIG